MNTTLPAATIRLVNGVFVLLRTDHDNALYYQRALGVVELCDVALKVVTAIQDEDRETGAAPVAVTVSRDLGSRIAELSAGGNGVRKIARILGVNPSTVSRRLASSRRCAQQQA